MNQKNNYPSTQIREPTLIGLLPNLSKHKALHRSCPRGLNLFLQTSQIIDDGLHAIDNPVTKLHYTAVASVFGPTSLTPVAFKVLEAILKVKMLAYMSKFSLLTPWKHGLLSGCTTLTNLHVAEELVTKWFDKGNTVDQAYLDFSKPLYSINRRLLPSKVRGYFNNPRCNELDWMLP